MSVPSLLEQIVRAAQVRQSVVADFMRRQNVIACGVGFKMVAGQNTGQPCIVVSVREKKPAAALTAADLIPNMIREIATDVVETGDIVPFGLNRRAVLRPIRPGSSIAHIRGTAGTFGCVVRHGDVPYILSNNHVLALLNQGKAGDPILQPGPGDGGTPANAVGALAEYEPLRFLDDIAPASTTPGKQPSAGGSLIGGIAGLLGRLFKSTSGATMTKPGTARPVPAPTTNENLIDAALARVNPELVLSPSIIDIGGAPLGVAAPRLGMRVMKSGRTTGLTQGIVTQIDVTIDVNYDNRRARFTNQIVLTPLSQPGDSGSLILDYERRAVALLFSGSSQVTVASPIQTVLSRLRVELETRA
ncbi:MAG: hypothetical protein IT326_08710 [Anaerolineae bacterium]|nr:hypothetical protein [Anaerolineae bacterium]